MARAVIYARFSCDRQREESIDDQVRVCRQEAERRGDTVVKVYADSAMSGRSDHRPNFLQMISDATRRKPFDRIYVYRYDRFARNRFHSAIYRQKLKDAGVELVSATERVPDSPEGILLVGIIESYAEFYSASLSLQVSRGMDGNALQCKTNGVSVYGFRAGEDGTYEEDPNESPIVRRIFSLLANGATFQAVCDELNGDGIRTRNGSEWSKACVGRMLWSDKYLGVYQWKDFIKPGGMPRIVDEDTVLEARMVKGARCFPKKSQYVYPLSGLLYTEDGLRLGGTFGTGKSGRRYRYYRCIKTGRTWPQEQLDSAIFDALSAVIRAPGFADVAAELAMEGQREVMADQIAEMEALRKRVGGIDREYRGLIDLAAKVGADDAIVEKMTALRDEKAQVEARIAEMESSSDIIEPGMVTYWIEKMLEERDVATLARTFCTRITLTEDGLARAEFNANYQRGAGVCFESSGRPTELSSKHRVSWHGAVLEAIPGGFIIEISLAA